MVGVGTPAASTVAVMVVRLVAMVVLEEVTAAVGTNRRRVSAAVEAARWVVARAAEMEEETLAEVTAHARRSNVSQEW
jgi:transcriptional regulator with GAF, ATPase, and Fis domain